MEEKPVWLVVAEKEIGVKEITGVEANKRIVEYAATTTLKATSDEVAWCSAFVNWVLKQAGMYYTRSASARSWLKGLAQIPEPMPGCVVVFKRGNNPQSGHVAFFTSFVGNGFIKVLGGNQGDSVKYSNYNTEDVLGYFWPGPVKV